MKINHHETTAPPIDGAYVNAHFRIRTPSYDPSRRWRDEDIDTFDAECRTLFDRLGWTMTEQRHNGSCATVHKDKSSLYLHPQDFSGEVLKSEVVSIAEALSRAETFALITVDLYETVYDLTDAEYISYLGGQEERIKAEVLKAGRTTRRNKFYRDYDVACHVAGIVRLRRIGEDDGRYGGAGKTANYIVGVIDKLITEGYLAEATSRNGNRLIRTLNKTEQKQKKLYVA